MTSKTHRRVFKGVTVEVEVGIDDDPSTQGYASKDNCCCSLASLIDSGGIDDGDDFIPVHERTIQEIERWAEQVGY